MKSIRTKFLVLILGCVLLTVAALGSVNLINAISVIEKDAEQITNLVCLEKAGEINTVLLGIEQSVETIYSYADRQMNTDDILTNQEEAEVNIQKIKEICRYAVDNTNGAVGVYIYFNQEVITQAEGIVLKKDKKSGEFQEYKIDTSQHIGKNINKIEGYRVSLETGEAVWIEPYYNEYMGFNTISYVIPWKRGEDVIGVIGMDIDMDMLKHCIYSVQIYETGYAFLANDKGQIYIHQKYPGKMPEEEKGEEFNYVIERLNSSNKKHIFKYPWQGEEHMAAYTTLENGMSFVVSVPMSEIDNSLNKVIKQTFLALIGIVVIAVILTIKMTDMVTQPLRQLTETARRIAGGDLEASFSCSSKDEVGILAESVQQMAGYLKHYIDYINELAYLDGMTGLYNKTAYLEKINRLDEEIRLGEIQFGVAVMDINNLKTVNDHYGHEEGDRMIKDAADIIKKSFPLQKIYRIGGDEFVVILTNISPENCMQMKSVLENEIVNFNSEQKRYYGKIYIAAGLAVFEKGKDVNYSMIFQRADSAMYENKIWQKQKIAKEQAENKKV